MKKSKPGLYCTSLWTHAYLNTKGQRDFCCFKDYNANSKVTEERVSLKEYWNSPLVKEARLRFLAGEPHESCYPCSHRVLYNDHPRNFFFDKYNDLEEAIRDSTDSLGHTKISPVFLDYRFSNKCNFACRMCSHGSSSKIEAIEGRPNSSLERLPFNESVALPEFKSLIESGVDQIYWGGGEPLVTQEHWELMDFIINKGLADKIEVTYNSNLSLLKFKRFDLIEVLRNFKSVKFLVSLDGIGELGEYIRQGLKWQETKKYIRELNNLENCQVRLTLTVTLPGLFGLVDLAKFIEDEQLEYDVHICHANGANDILSPLILPRHILSECTENLIGALEAAQLKRSIGLIRNLKILSTQKTIEENFSKDFDKIFFSCREELLKREPEEGLSLDKILAKNKAVHSWWFRAPDVVQPKLSLYEESWVELIDKKLGEDFVIYTENPQAIHRFYNSKLKKVKAHAELKPPYEKVICVLNEPELLNYLFEQYLGSKHKCFLILPSKNWFNRILSKDLKKYKKKVEYMESFMSSDVKILESGRINPSAEILGGKLAPIVNLMNSSFHDYYLIEL